MVYVQTKRYGNEVDSWKDGFFDYNGMRFSLPYEYLWFSYANLLATIGPLEFHGLPFNYFHKIVFATDIYHDAPPPLNKMDIEYKPSPFELTTGKSFR